MIRAAFFTGSRSEYGLIQPIIRQCAGDERFKTFLIVSASHLDELYGKSENEIEKAGLAGVLEIKLSQIGSAKTEVSRTIATIIKEGSRLLERIRPHVILIAGDRYESFGMAVASFYANVPIAHIFGGDVSQGGHLDDSARHSLTKLAHIHFATNQDSMQRILNLGEERWRVFNVGSPVIDSIRGTDIADEHYVAKTLGLNLEKPVILFTFHPVTTESEKAYKQVKPALEALEEFGQQTVITYPCKDPGSKLIIKAINEHTDTPHFRIKRNLGWKLYLGTMKIASCVAGNSSSGLMETPFFQVPCINIGSRQSGRLRADNVIDAKCDKQNILAALHKSFNDSVFMKQVRNCRNPYDNGCGTSKTIIETIFKLHANPTLLKKKITY